MSTDTKLSSEAADLLRSLCDGSLTSLKDREVISELADAGFITSITVNPAPIPVTSHDPTPAGKKWCEANPPGEKELLDMAERSLFVASEVRPGDKIQPRGQGIALFNPVLVLEVSPGQDGIIQIRTERGIIEAPPTQGFYGIRKREEPAS